jgi:hypothetical protein
MTIKEFAEKHNLNVRRDSCGEETIPGKPSKAERVEDRSHVYDHGDGKLFGVCLLFASAKRWGNAKRRLLALGSELRQQGDTEGTLLFDPENEGMAKAALREAGVKRRRIPSGAQLKVLERARQSLDPSRNEHKTTKHGPAGVV